jgi:oxygen-dependent protoporphyrinogen oxidase
LSAIHEVPVSVVQLGWRTRLEPEPQGFGFLVPAIERQPILGVIYASAVFPFRAPGGGTLLTTLVGGAHRRDLAALPDDELVGLVRDALRSILGIDRAPDLAEVFRWPHAIPQYEIGHQGRLDALGLAVRALPGLFLTGNAYRGPGIADCVREGLALGDSLARTGTHQ